MSRITTDHISREAIVYVRQSTMKQVLGNPGSREWQYGLRDRAGALGWSEPVVIDEDLGRSGDGSVRPGFDRMLGAVCRGEIGIILAVDATRLARNGTEWHRLIDHCALVGCLLADEQSVYDPRIPSDRLMLGVQGAMSELEASNIRRRMMEGKLRKAERGALFSSVPAGYVRIGKERIEKDPGERVRSVLELVFRRFDELQSLRQVMLWLLDEGIELPARTHGGTGREVNWTRPTYSRVRDIMENPVYAGAYAFGRSVMRTEVRDGRKHAVQKKIPRPEDWAILIKDRHEGYINWERYERNRQVIADNAQRLGREGARGAVRGGAALLAGLLRCGHCGRKLTVSYSGRWNTFRYACGNGAVNRGDDKCISLNGRRVDEAVGGALLRAIEPVAMEAALRAVEEDREAKSDAVRQAELALEQARYEADRAFRQFDGVDPENRQVAAELERRWNGRLVAASEMEAALARAQEADREFRMGDAERAACLELGADLERAWCHERVSPEIRKRILRAALVEALAHVEDRRVRLVLHWQGGDHSEVSVEKSPPGRHRYATDEETSAIITALARQLPDESIAAMLNRSGRHTGKGRRWRKASVASFRAYRKIAAYREGEEKERGELGVREAARILGVRERTVIGRIASGKLPAWQVCKGAPWVIKADDLFRERDPAQPSLFDAGSDDGSAQKGGRRSRNRSSNAATPRARKGLPATGTPILSMT